MPSILSSVTEETVIRLIPIPDNMPDEASENGTKRAKLEMAEITSIQGQCGVTVDQG